MRRTAECGPAGEEGTNSSSTVATDADQEDSAELSRDSTSSFEENAVEHESNEDISSLSVCELRKALQDAKKKNTDLHENLSTSKKKLKTAARKTKRLEKDLSALAKNLDFLKEDQKAALKRKSRKGSAWSAETIKKALQLKFACGSAGYDLLLEQGKPLPSLCRTLCRLLQHLSFNPSVLIDIVNMMKVKVAAMSNIEKDCVIFLDEMEIRKGVELYRSGDGFLGKVTLPETDRAANHVLVFMVGGLNTRCKQVIAYHYTGAFVNGEKLRDFVFHLINLCADISLRVLCVTCDMGSSNRAMWRSLNLSSSRYSVTKCTVPHPCDNSMSLFFMPDPSQQMKLHPCGQ
nr:uncharacterized protein LOC129380430 [Dermacentor andersoni]